LSGNTWARPAEEAARIWRAAFRRIANLWPNRRRQWPGERGLANGSSRAGGSGGAPTVKLEAASLVWAAEREGGLVRRAGARPSASGGAEWGAPNGPEAGLRAAAAANNHDRTTSARPARPPAQSIMLGLPVLRHSCRRRRRRQVNKGALFGRPASSAII